VVAPGDTAAQATFYVFRERAPEDPQELEKMKLEAHNFYVEISRRTWMCKANNLESVLDPPPPFGNAPPVVVPAAPTTAAGCGQRRAGWQ
jgi:hypothetical protein